MFFENHFFDMIKYIYIYIYIGLSEAKLTNFTFINFLTLIYFLINK